jgi:hypothetical protein
MSDYEISRTAGQCSVCGRHLEEGEQFYSAVFESGEAFQRRDIGDECWTGPPADAMCHFRTRIARKAERRKVFVDDGVLLEFFGRLAGAVEPARLRFRFVLALILLRKRLLKYEQTERDAGQEFWLMRATRDKQLHRVLNPQLDESQIEGLTVELGSILEGFAAEQATGGDAALDNADGLPVEEAAGLE